MEAMRRALAAIGAVLLLAAGAACGSGDERPSASPSPVATAPPTASASPSPTPTPTPVATATPSASATASPSPAADAPPLPDSVREVLDELAALRGLDPPPSLRADTVSRDDLPALIKEGFSEAELARFDEITTLYRLLGHLRPDQDYWSVLREAFRGGVAGLYDPEGKRLWVVTHDVEIDDLNPWQRETLAHELLHALQDHYVDLGAMMEDRGHDLDRELAARAVVEGDAEYHTRLWAERDRGWRPAGGAGLPLRGLPQQIDVPEAVIREFAFPYEWGSIWAEAAIERGGLDAINAALRDPPPTTAHIIHPDAIAPDWTPEAVALPPLADALGAGWRLESEGPLGEFQLINYLLPDFSGPPRRDDDRAVAAAEAAAGWRGDWHAVYANGGESVMAARVRFADAEEAREFDETHRAIELADAETVTEGALTLATRADGVTVALAAPTGRDILFAIGSNAAIARAALEALLGG